MYDNYENLLKKLIVATNKKYPDRDMNLQIINAIKKYFSVIDNNSKDYILANDYFCRCFVKVDKDSKEKVREELTKVGIKNDAVLSLFDFMYRYALCEISKSRVERMRETYIDNLLKYINSYVDVINQYKTTDLSSARAKIYGFPQKITHLTNVLSPLMGYFIEDSLKKEDVSKREEIDNNSTIKINEVTETGQKLFSNIKSIFDFELQENYSGTYKAGNVNIQMATALGYKTKKRPQQDAIMSASKDNCSISVVADGAGGSLKGQIASTIVINELNNWFNSNDFSIFNNISPDDSESIKKASSVLSNSLDQKIKNISNYVSSKYPGSLSTVVVAIVTPGFILFANVGDSTAYVYNQKERTIEEKTVLDSFSKGLSYEAARNNPDNNVITSAIGDMTGAVHYNVMPNKGPYRIVLSSDGITDLISADNFEQLISKGYSAEDFVNKANYYPDIKRGMKSEDNISAIVIDSNDYNKKRRTR